MNQFYQPITDARWITKPIFKAWLPAILVSIMVVSTSVVASADDLSTTIGGNASCPITTSNADDVKLLSTLTDHTDRVWTVRFSPDGTKIASCGEDGKVIIRPMDDLDSSTVIQAYGNWVVGLAFSPDGQEIASGAADGFSGSSGPIALWDVATGTQKDLLLGHTGGVWSLDYQESTGILASGSLDRTVRLWDPSTGTLLRTLTGHTGYVLSVDISPTANQVVSSATDHTIRLWDMQTGALIRSFLGHSNNVGFVKFSPDGTRIASSADDGTVRLWEVATGAQLWSVSAGQGWVNCVNFSPDGNVLLTCGHNGSVVLRDVATGNELIRFAAHVSAVLRGAFRPDGCMFADASWDQTVKLWAIPTSIDSVGQTPDDPAYDDTVVVGSKMTDCSGIADITLYYSKSDTYQATSMFDDGLHGDGAAGDLVYGGLIPPVPFTTLVKYYVSVTDSNGVVMTDPPEAPDSYYEYQLPCCAGRTGNVNYDPESVRDLNDILMLASYAFLGGDPPPCMAEMNVDGDAECIYDLSDILALASYAFLSGEPPAYCMPECE